MFTIGSVPYANARPLLEGLAERDGVRLVREPPSRLAGLLGGGELDVALVPSVEHFRNPEWVIVPGGCISSRGPVASVSLFCRGPFPPGPRILVDASSLTSAALLRILLPGPPGILGARFEPCPPTVDPRTADADGVLLIGDPCLVQDRGGLGEIDLRDAWTRWTGLPFVWAVWAARDEAAAAVAGPLLEEARRKGREAMPAIVRREAERLQVAEE